MAQKRKTYNAKEKMTILKKHLLDHTPVSDICDRYGISPSMFYRWQKQLFEDGHSVFESTAKPRRDEQRFTALKAKLTKKDEIIAELMEEHLALKKDLGEL